MTHVASRPEQLDSHLRNDGFLYTAKESQIPTQKPANGHTFYPATNGAVKAQQPDGLVGVPNGKSHSSQAQNGYQQATQTGSDSEKLDVLCGPLINFRRLDKAQDGNVTWHGSVLVVTKPGGRQPELKLCLEENARGALRNEQRREYQTTAQGGAQRTDEARIFRALKLHETSDKVFWCFELDVPSHDTETCWKYELLHVQLVSASTNRSIPPKIFVVPARAQSMRILFHSCNGFSVGTDEEAWSGPALWNDVLRSHDQQSFHVMIGGGDQIYNDGVRVDGPLREWADMGNPKRRRDHPFGEELQAECDQFYFQNYAKWYSTEPFSTANSQIPQINIWDDHDIIDGFGSYTDHFMRCPVFRGIGAISYKYYCLFQHHVSPPTSKAPQIDGAGAKPDGTAQHPAPDPSYIMGSELGPYISRPSLSLFTQLGANVAFLGIDARTERTRHQINYPSTYSAIFSRVSASLSSNRDIKHLIVLLGVPIAYPRLAWLEQIFTSPLIGPIRFLNKRFGVAGSFFNKFDGKPDLLDDLDDHYTARQHKHERKRLIHSLQEIAAKHSVRVTILGGDVHLAALGSFYSNPKQALPKEKDHRYMANIISSAITNHPPPKAVADLLARRNKVHHLDHETDETLIPLFEKNPGGVEKSSAFNKLTMPSRNYAIITENRGAGRVDEINGNNDDEADGDAPNGSQINGNKASQHAPTTERKMGGLDVTFRVEIDQHDAQGKTDGYGFSVPPLEV